MSSKGAGPHTISGSRQHTAKKQSSGSVQTRENHIAHIAKKYANSPLKKGWVLDADIRIYIDSIPHAQLREILSCRVNDSAITRPIRRHRFALEFSKCV